MLERGKQIEPDNAFYPLAMAGLLLRGSSNRTEDDDHPPAAVPYVDSDGRPRDLTWSTRIEVFDPAAFARGLAELREAAGKPYLSSHAADLAERRMRLLPAPTRVSDALLRGEVEQSALSSTEHTSVLASAIQIAGCYAVQKAEQGEGKEALQLVGDERKVSRLAASGARLGNELYNADGMYHSTLRQEAGIQPAAGQAAGGTGGGGAVSGILRRVRNAVSGS